MQKKWTEIEHGADIGLIAESESVNGLFQSAAEGMISLMLDTRTVAPVCSRTVKAEGPDTETLLVGWLEEILFLLEVEGFAPHHAGEVTFESGAVTGTVEGEEFDSDKHEHLHSIKAVTWHGLKVTKENGVYKVRVIFDV